MAADVWQFGVRALADGLKIAAPTSTAVYYKIILPATLSGYGDGVYININSSCMESGTSLSFSGTCNVAGANAVTFAYDTTSARVVAWSVE